MAQTNNWSLNVITKFQFETFKPRKISVDNQKLTNSLLCSMQSYYIPSDLTQLTHIQHTVPYRYEASIELGFGGLPIDLARRLYHVITLFQN